MSDFEKTLEIVFGRWKSQTLYAGVKLGVFECLTSEPKNTSDIAKQLSLDFALTYRLLRALASLGFLIENTIINFQLAHRVGYFRIIYNRIADYLTNIIGCRNRNINNIPS